jgi:pilus assembly protein CpaE
MRKVHVLIAGRSEEEVRAAEALLAGNALCETGVRVITNGHVDPLHGVSTMPDLLLLCERDAQAELQTLSSLPLDERPELIVFGPGEDAKAMRMAMRAGARDYLTLPLDEAELNEAVEQIAADIASKREDSNGTLHVFINGKGGSGATFMATNIAHGLASNDHRVTLVDLDLQFAGLCRYLDLSPTRNLVEAVNAVDDMDEVSAEAFTAEHDSGLRLLSGKADDLCLNADIQPERLVALLKHYQTFNDYVIVDLPRHVDMLSAAVLENADRITVVMQQSFPHLHDTSRLVAIMRNNLGVPKSKMTVVVNRYVKDSAILLKDIENALQIEDLVKIPNHYRLTEESVNTGIPLAEVKHKANVAKSLREYYQRIDGSQSAESFADGATRKLQSFFRS